MIEIVIADDCSFCKDQVKILKNVFAENQIKIIDLNSQELAQCDFLHLIESVPFLVFKLDNEIKYAGTGIHDEETLIRLTNELILDNN